MEKKWSDTPRSQRLGALKRCLKRGRPVSAKVVVQKRDEFNRIKHSLLPMHGRQCFVCDSPAEHRHHIIPLNRGGQNVLKNLVRLCVSCHVAVDGKKRNGKKGPSQPQNPPGPHAILPVRRTAPAKPALSACDKVVFVKVA